jgi:poly(3-hydroxybutyrate) depolymerase
LHKLFGDPSVVGSQQRSHVKGGRMLYQLYESQRALLSPFAEFASASSKLYNHPLSPFTHTPLAHRVSAGLELMHRLAKEYEKPEFNIHSVRVDNVDVAVQQQVAIEKPFCRLLRFKRFTDDLPMLTKLKDQPIVLVVAPLSGHHSTLLRGDRPRTAARPKVFVTDWTDARMVPLQAGPFHLKDYVAYVQEFIRHIGPEVNVISVCQPTVPVLAAVALMATHGEPTPLTMTMMGGPIDARKSPTAVNNLATNKSLGWFESNVIYRVPDQLPGGRPAGISRLSSAHRVHRDEPRPPPEVALRLLPEPGARRRRQRRLPPRVLRRIQRGARHARRVLPRHHQGRVPDFALVNGTWNIDGERVRPEDIKTTALLTIEGELDDISGAGQTQAAHALCTGVPASRQFHYDVAGAGHYGIFSGRRWREKVYPRVRDFIASYQTAISEAKAAAAVKSKPKAKRAVAAAVNGKAVATNGSAGAVVKSLNGTANGKARKANGSSHARTTDASEEKAIRLIRTAARVTKRRR